MTWHLSTVDRAKDRWREILPKLGIDAKFLTKRHGPCPLCKGVDRFRFDDKDGSGSYYCNQCGAGAGLILVRKRNNWDYKTACDRIDEIIGTDTSPTTASSTTSLSSSSANKRRAIEDVVRAADAPDVVAGYLKRRGLAVTSNVLLGHSRCPYYGPGAVAGYLPAVIAPIIGPDGGLQSVMRIYDADVEPRKKIMTPIDTIKGAAVRLFPATDILAVAEGVETGLAVHQMTGLPVWAVLNADNLREWSPPAGVSTVAVYGDHDINFVGQAAAYGLAKRLAAIGIAATVHIPLKPDTDWLDVLVAGGAP